MPASIFIPQLQPVFWHKMYCFYYVAHCGSYSKAARMLHITQSSLSRAVKALEQRLNTVLLLRNSRHLSLTPCGQQMIKDIQVILEKLKKIESFAERPVMTTTETIVVVVEEPLLCDYLLKPLLSFQQHRSDLKLELRSRAFLVTLPPSRHRVSIDLGFKQSSRYIQKPLLGFESAFYASQSYLQRFEAPLTLEDLSKHRLLLLNESIPGIFEDMNWHEALLKKSVPQTMDHCSVHSPEHLFNMTAAGFGIMAWVKGHPYLKASPLTEILQSVSLLHGPTNQAYFVCEEPSFKTEGVQALYLYLKQYCDAFSKH